MIFAAAIGLVVVLLASGSRIDSFNGFLIALGLLITAATGAYSAWANHHLKRTTKEIRHELITLNEGTVGSFAADAETRRVEEIPHDERTPTEQRHVDSAPDPEEPQGPSR